MAFESKSIRTFIGAKDFTESRAFYTALGFQEVIIDSSMSLFKVNQSLAFYLQDYYLKDWINNSMVFLEVESIDKCQKELLSKNLTDRFKTVKISDIKVWDWGKEIFMHDPSGVLWHFGKFNQ